MVNRQSSPPPLFRAKHGLTSASLDLLLTQVLSVEIVDELADRGLHGRNKHHLEVERRDDVELHHVADVWNSVFVDALSAD